jgi:hypothetical protein
MLIKLGIARMARRKNHPEAVKAKCRLSERLHEIRVERYGERGGSEMARQLGLPVRTWYNYETGVTVPAEVLLKFMELTSVEPRWLLHGCGAKYRAPADEAPSSVPDLLRAALRRLEQGDRAPGPNRPRVPALVQAADDGEHGAHGVLTRVQGGDCRRLEGPDQPGFLAAHAEWLAACRESRCVRVNGDAMAPLLADGAYVAFSAEDEPPHALDGSLVVAWVDHRPCVRWLEITGRYALLRPENPSEEAGTRLLDLDGPPGDRLVRRVVWISTPH